MRESLSSLADDAALLLSDKQREMEEVLASLVELNSYTDNADGGRLVGSMLRDLFGRAGRAGAAHGSDADAVRERVIASARYADHLVFETPSAQSAPPIALVGHFDTVFPPGVFEGYRRDGDLARGPGVLDMKGGIVVVLYALRAVGATLGFARAPKVEVVLVADEEVGSPEGQGVIREAIAGASSCLVFEAGRKADMIITRRKGTGGMRAIAHGRAAHAGANHKDGANALWAIARFVDRIQQLTDYDRGITVNVGKVEGGQGKNTVPDQAVAHFDLRFESKADADWLVAEVNKAAEAAAASVPGTRIVLEGGVARLPLERTAESARLMQEYGACARASGLGDGEAPLIGGGSDASTASALGIASIDGLGPRGIGFHTKDEQIEVATLVPKAQALARFLIGRGSIA